MAADPPNPLPVPLCEIEIRFVRSSGPGGQNVNKVSTKAVLRWPVERSRAVPAPVRARFYRRYAHRITRKGEILLTSDRFRDQGRNAAACVARLQAMLDAVAAEPRPRKPTQPGRAAAERRLTEKRRRGEAKRQRGRPSLED